jgi:hypothetical protein
MRESSRLVLAVAVLLFAASVSVQATPIVYSGSSGSLSASASFDYNPSESILTIILSNTSNSDVLLPQDVLTGLFFNSNYAFDPNSAARNGSSMYYGYTSDPGKGWGYATGVNAQGMNSAISASGAVSGLGYSNFSSTSQYLDGLNYGILSAGDNPYTGNSGVIYKGPLFKSSLQFTLSAPDEFALDDIGSLIVFQYGTSLSEISFSGYSNPPAVPEPGTVLLLGTGMCALALSQRRKIRSFFKSSAVNRQS